MSIVVFIEISFIDISFMDIKSDLSFIDSIYSLALIYPVDDYHLLCDYEKNLVLSSFLAPAPSLIYQSHLLAHRQTDTY